MKTKVSAEHRPALGKTSVVVGVYTTKMAHGRRKFHVCEHVLLKPTGQVGTIVSLDTYRTAQFDLERHPTDTMTDAVIHRLPYAAMYSYPMKWRSRSYYTVALLNGDVVNCIPVCDLERRVE